LYEVIWIELSAAETVCEAAQVRTVLSAQFCHLIDGRRRLIFP
jgi:hypothetical protein